MYILATRMRYESASSIVQSIPAATHSSQWSSVRAFKSSTSKRSEEKPHTTRVRGGKRSLASNYFTMLMVSYQNICRESANTRMNRFRTWWSAESVCYLKHFVKNRTVKWKETIHAPCSWVKKQWWLFWTWFAILCFFSVYLLSAAQYDDAW